MNPMFLRLGLLIGVCAGLGACASSVEELNAAGSTLPVAAGRYDTTFNAARQVLRDRGFILERVDAHDGVITTQPKTTAGLLTPWDLEQQTFGQEVEDLFERQQRVVRITFDPPEPPESAPAATSAAPAVERTMRVQVTIQRVHIPGRKLEPEAVSQTSYYYDPELGARAMQPSYAVAYKEDRLLEARLTELISAAAAAPAPSTPDSSTEPAEPKPAPTEPPQAPQPAEPQRAPWVPGQPLHKSG